MGYEITLRDRSIELVEGANAFAHDKSMTTFYLTGNARNTVDCWSSALACIRTEEILMIRQLHSAATTAATTARPGHQVAEERDSGRGEEQGVGSAEDGVRHLALA